VVDIRYSMLPHQIAPLWGIELAKNVSAQSYVRYVTTRGDTADSRVALSQLWTMMFE